MAVRPNFLELVRIQGDNMVVAGTSDDDPLPDDIQVFVEQGGPVDGASVGGHVNKASSAWQATLPSAGFQPGTAVASGLEIRTRPFLVTTWSQMVKIQ